MPDSKDRVDLSQPLLAQVAALGGDYEAWVHDSIGPSQAEQVMKPLVEAGDEIAVRWPTSLRIFHNPVLESLSHIPWKIIPLIWAPVSAALLWLALAKLGMPAGGAAIWWVVGCFGWTLLEYLLHRFLFHYVPKTAFGLKVHFLAHGIHHLDPWDGTRLVFPPLAALVFAAGIFGVVRLFVPLPQVCAFMSGLLVGYIAYDLLHYYTHHARPTMRWGKFLRAWHLAHHFKFWTRMYGVSSPLWDIILRTGRPADNSPKR